MLTAFGAPTHGTALENFQKTKGMNANGALDQQTLSDLGVTISENNQGSASNEETQGRQQGMNSDQNSSAMQNSGLDKGSAMRTSAKGSTGQNGQTSSANNAQPGASGSVTGTGAGFRTI